MQQTASGLTSLLQPYPAFLKKHHIDKFFIQLFPTLYDNNHHPQPISVL